MIDLEEGDRSFFVVYDVDRSVITDAKTVTETALQSLAPLRPRFVAESEYGSDDPLPVLLPDLIELPLGLALDETR